MNRRHVSGAIALLAPTLALAQISLEPIGRYTTGVFDGGAAEISAYDAGTRRLFVTNAGANTVDVLDLSDPTEPSLLFTIDCSEVGGGVNSVAAFSGIVAVAVEGFVKTDPGTVAFFAAAGNGRRIASAAVGALPDMLAFTPDGRFVVVACEGEPNDDYSIDPEGEVCVIEVPRVLSKFRSPLSVRRADFSGFNGLEGHLRDSGVRIFGPGATAAQDIEPEYVAITPDSATAWVTLQENNAFAVVDLATATVTEIIPLGLKDHSTEGFGLDPSDRDDAISVGEWPVRGMFLPDAIAAYSVGGATWFITANEGDAREWGDFAEEERIKDLDLDPDAFPDAEVLQQDEAIGRLNVSSADGDIDEDGDYDALHCFGGRSFSIWDDQGDLVFDSGDALEQATAAAFPDDFNADNAENGTFDNRSDNKGPEPEGVTVAQLGGRWYAFLCLERIGGIAVYDVTNPAAPVFVEYVNNRNFSGDPEQGTAGDLGPEASVFVPANRSPINVPLLIVTNEVSGSTTVYRIDQ